MEETEMPLKNSNLLKENFKKSSVIPHLNDEIF